jgi:hypothetical protein
MRSRPWEFSAWELLIFRIVRKEGGVAVDELVAAKLYAAVMLRARGYRQQAVELRDQAADTNDVDTRETYLRLAQGQEALADRAARLVEGRVSR